VLQEPTMCNRDSFLRYAEQCERMAQVNGVAPQYHAALKTMAQGWRHLAAEEERLDGLIRKIDHFLSAPDAAAEQHGPATRARTH
jgi:hypothetical protein